MNPLINMPRDASSDIIQYLLKFQYCPKTHHNIIIVYSIRTILVVRTIHRRNILHNVVVIYEYCDDIMHKRRDTVITAAFTSMMFCRHLHRRNILCASHHRIISYFSSLNNFEAK